MTKASRDREAPPVSDRGLSWIEQPGPENEIVISSRVRLARNIQGYPFASHMTDRERAVLLDRAREAVENAGTLGELDFWDVAGLQSLDRHLLFERRLVSRELIIGPKGSSRPGTGLALARASAIGVLVNEEDHLRLQALRPGFQIDGAWRDLDRLDEEIGAQLPYAFHQEFGFLTSCPTNAGTGLRASVLIHLPGLVLTRQIRRVLEGMGQLGVTHRGLYGEGSKVIGNLFQISNQTTLGRTEMALIDHLEGILRGVIGYERQARSELLREAPNEVEDKVWRAYGTLRHARSLPFEEMMNLLSAVRLGVALNLLHSPSVQEIGRMMMQGQAAHLARAAGRRLSEADADAFRAQYVRGVLAAGDESLG